MDATNPSVADALRTGALARTRVEPNEDLVDDAVAAGTLLEQASQTGAGTTDDLVASLRRRAPLPTDPAGEGDGHPPPAADDAVAATQKHLERVQQWLQRLAGDTAAPLELQANRLHLLARVASGALQTGRDLAELWVELNEVVVSLAAALRQATSGDDGTGEDAAAQHALRGQVKVYADVMEAYGGDLAHSLGKLTHRIDDLAAEATTTRQTLAATSLRAPEVVVTAPGGDNDAGLPGAAIIPGPVAPTLESVAANVHDLQVNYSYTNPHRALPVLFAAEAAQTTGEAEQTFTRRMEQFVKLVDTKPRL